MITQNTSISTSVAQIRIGKKRIKIIFIQQCEIRNVDRKKRNAAKIIHVITTKKIADDSIMQPK